MTDDQSLSGLTERLFDLPDPVVCHGAAARLDASSGRHEEGDGGGSPLILLSCGLGMSAPGCAHRISAGRPEELNRRIADLCRPVFRADAVGGDNLLREGVPASRTHVIGNTVVENAKNAF